MTDQTPDDTAKETPDDTARARHMTISWLSFGAAFMAAGGAWMLSARAPDGVPDAAGYAVLIIAILIFFFGPNWLRKKWREQDNKGDGQ